MLHRLLNNNCMSIAAHIAALICTMLILSCTKDNPVQVPEPTWNLTLDVLNGYTGDKISGASVQYMKGAIDTAVISNSEGRVKIEGLNAGTQSFTISYADSATKYTSIVMQATSLSSQDSGKVAKLADQAKTIKLFPLTGAFSGRLLSQINPMAVRIPVANAVISVTYKNPDLENATNVATSVKTSDSGIFSFTGLPVASGLMVTIAPITISSTDFGPGSFTMPILASGISIPMGTVVMTPINADNFKILSSLPSVIAPNDSIVLTYSDPLDSNSYANLEGVNGSQSVPVKSISNGTKLILKPAISLVDSNQYRLAVHAFGWAGGSASSVCTLSVKGGGIIDVISSNVIDGNHLAKDGLGLTDSMKFSFRTLISTASASVKNKATGEVVLVDIVIYGDELYIIPKGSWKSGIYNVKISANLNDGKASTFNFDIATVGALDFVSSNVYNPQLESGINGLGFKDTIVVTTNKPLASAQVILLMLTDSSVASVPISWSINDQTVKIVSLEALRPAGTYSINITVSTAQGESKSFSGKFTTASSDFYPVSDNIRFDNDPMKPVLNFPPNGTIIIKMSAAIASATAQVSDASINVTFSNDTIRITPVGNLVEGKKYILKISAKSVAGTVYNETYVKDFSVQANKAFIVASNVMNTNGLGLSNIPVTTAPYYVLSSTADQATIMVTLKPVTDEISGALGTAVDVTVSFTGDTIRIKPVNNLKPATKYVTSIKGKTTQNMTVDLSLSSTAAFTTSPAVFVVATNMLDMEGNPVNNLLPSSELWIKFSRPLSTDLTKHKLGGTADSGVTVVTYSYGAVSNNTTIRVNKDTLFAKFLPSMLPDYGNKILLESISLLFDDATTAGSAIVKFNAYIISKQKPYVIATNGYKDNVLVDTFNVLDEVWIKSSLHFRSVNKIKNGSDTVFTNIPTENLVLSNVRTKGDTIFFKPATRLNYSVQYEVAFDVTLSDSTVYTGNDLKLRWQTRKGLALDSANDLVASKAEYRPFNVTGDTLIIYFSKAIDTTKVFEVKGFANNKVTYTWGQTKRRVRIIPIEPLAIKPYDPNPDYSINSTGAQYSNLTITATSVDGETWVEKVASKSAFDDKRPAIAIHTVPGIEVLNTSLVVSSANIKQFYVNTSNTRLSDLVSSGKVIQNDSVNYGDTIKVYFSRAVDSAAVASSTPHAVQLLADGIDQNVNVWYASSRKTMLIKPVVQMNPGTSYSLKLTSVQPSGMPSGSVNATVSYLLAFTTKVPPTKSVTAALVVLHADTALTTDVNGKRLGYSGSKSNAYENGLIPTSVPSLNTVQMYWKDVAFASTTDTVTHYQYSVKGINGSWYDLKTLVPAHHYDPFNPLSDSIYKYTLDISGTVIDVNGSDIGPALRVPAMDANHQNDASIFNYGAIIQVKVRPVVSANGTWDAGDKGGNWSAALSFQDNIAPCDSDFVATAASPANLINKANGGVSISSTTCAMNRSALAGSQYNFVFNFPEDMDKTTKPSISVWYGDTAGLGSVTSRIVVDSINSYWNNDYQYQMTLTVPGNVNWTTFAPYYALSVGSMKDASNQTIVSWGHVGTAGNNTLRTTADNTETRGSANLKGLTDF